MGTMQQVVDDEITATTQGSDFDDNVDDMNGDLVPHTVLIPPGDYPGGEAANIPVPGGP